MHISLSRNAAARFRLLRVEEVGDAALRRSKHPYGFTVAGYLYETNNGFVSKQARVTRKKARSRGGRKEGNHDGPALSLWAP